MSSPPRRAFVAAMTATIALAAAVVTFLVTPSAQAADSRDSFITRCGIRFCLDGKAYYFAGTNTYDMFTFGVDWLPGEQYMDKAKIDTHMARLQTDGVTVLRLWMFSHEDWHGFEAAKGVYNEQEFALFDYIIKSARDHFIRLDPRLRELLGGLRRHRQAAGLGRAGRREANRGGSSTRPSAPAASPSTRTTSTTRWAGPTSSPGSNGSTIRPCSPGS